MQEGRGVVEGKASISLQNEGTGWLQWLLEGETDGLSVQRVAA